MQEIYFRPQSKDTSIAGTALEAWNVKLMEAAKIIGKDWWCTPKYKVRFEDAGFVKVQKQVFPWLGNAWPKGEKQKELGRLMLANVLKGVSAVSLAVLKKAFGMNVEEVEDMLVDVRKDIKDRKF